MPTATRNACTAVIIILLVVTQAIFGRSASETEPAPLQSGPTLILISPLDGSEYIDGIPVTGEASPSPDVGEGDRRVDTLTWEIPELEARGYIMFHRSGRFLQIIPTDDADGDLTLILRLADEAGRITEHSVLVQPGVAMY